jgi:hypothetical protein
VGDPEAVDGEGERWVLPSALGATSLVQDACDVANVVFLDRDGSAPRLDSVHPADAVPALLRRGFNHFRNPEEALMVAVGLARGASCWRLRLGDPIEAAGLITEAMP